MVLRQNPVAAGFSLIELLVVVAITSVLAISTTLVFARKEDPSRQAADALLADMTAVRRQAMASAIDHAIFLDRDGWRIERARGNGLWRAMSTHVLPNDIPLVLSAPDLRVLLRRDGSVEAFRATFGVGTSTTGCQASDGALPICDRL